jgi:hypothetical protein
MPDHPALTPCTCRQAVHTREHAAAVDGCPWCTQQPKDQPREQTARTTRNNPLASDNSLHELRAWLATERAKAQAADRPDCDPALLVTPHNGIAAGLAIALAWVNHRLGEALDSGPSVAECRADDRVWPLQKAGE